MMCPECGKEMRKGYLFASKDGAFSFAAKVPGVFENAGSRMALSESQTSRWDAGRARKPASVTRAECSSSGIERRERL